MLTGTNTFTLPHFLATTSSKGEQMSQVEKALISFVVFVMAFSAVTLVAMFAI